MPILEREVDVHPEDLLDRPEVGRETDVCWWALYTLPRHEKKLMRRLHGLDIPFYTPLVPKRSLSPAGRVRVAYVPLFTGYVFIYGHGKHRYEAMATQCVSRWLVVPDGEQLTHDLLQIRRLIESGAPLTPEARLEAGMRVRIRSGSMQGVEGVVIKRQNETRLLVTVDFLQQGASVLIDDVQLQRVD